MIISYKTGSAYYADNIADYLGTPANSTISTNGLMQFARTKGLSPRRTIFDLSTSSIQKHIFDNDPIYMGAKNITDSSQLGHAFVIMGYQQNINSGAILQFRIWNPWYDYFETLGLDQIYVTDRGVRYEGEEYLIDW